MTARGRTWRIVSLVAQASAGVVLLLAVVVNIVATVASAGIGWALIAPLASAWGIAVGVRYSYLGLSLIAAAPLLAVAAGTDPTGTWSIAVIAGFALVLRGAPALLVGLVTAVVNLLATAIVLGGVSLSEPIPTIAAFAALLGAAAGSALRSQTSYILEIEQRAEDAVASRAAAVREGVAEERVRIARDLHDSVGHSIAVVSMHLGSAEVQLPGDAANSREALFAARVAVQEVLAETQAIMRVLGADADPLLPTPTLGGIARLLETASATGLQLDAELVGLDRAVPPAIGTAAYRIVQECLTNALRHGTGSVTVRVRTDAAAVVLEVVNRRGARGETSGSGYGIIGMRERATSVGGSCDARAEGALFWVRCTLPVTEVLS